MTGKRWSILDAFAGLISFHAWKVQQHCEARTSFNQSTDCRAAKAQDQVAFPMTRNSPIGNFSRTFTDHDGSGDERFSAAPRSLPGQAKRPTGTQAGRQLSPQCPASLDIK